MISVQTLISVISVCGAIIFGYVAMRRNDVHDIKDSTEEKASLNAIVMTKLDMISEDLGEIKRDNKDLRTDVNDLKERVTLLEHGVR